MNPRHYPVVMRPVVRQLGEVADGGGTVADQTASKLSWLGLLVLAGGMFYLGRSSVGWGDRAKERMVGGVKKRVKRAVSDGMVTLREWAGE